MTTVTRYHPILVAIHWLLAALIVADLTIGTVVLVHIPNDAPLKVEGLRSHLMGGLLILTLMCLRLGIRLVTSTPPEASTGYRALDRLAWLSHRSLYVAVFGIALSGLAMGIEAHVPQAVLMGAGTLPATFWVFPLRYVHFFFAKLLMALITLHILGALYHMVVHRDGLLRRMWFGRRRQAQVDLLSKAAP